RMRVASVGFAIFGVILAASLLAGFVASEPPDRINLDAALERPSLHHPFGTDPFGRDVFSRIVHGSRISLGVGFLARTISLVLGLFLGSVAGYFGGRLDSILMRLADITFAYPTLLLLIAVIAVVSPGMVSLFVTLGVVGWASVARLVRAQVLSVKEREFVQAARASGAGSYVILFRHILPQCLAPVIVVYTLGLGMTIMAESSLSFLGLGVQPPAPSWGGMISSGIAFMRTAPWLTFFPGLVLTLTVCSLNLIGDGLRDALDPRLARALTTPAAASGVEGRAAPEGSR
ncbi:MAG TPA: ABC transporter permease, partial [Candidatus Bathyarchaeia archaeon]|nr:ABC transporter permease [Candidatus Bathyarchaeia archaeon]